METKNEISRNKQQFIVLTAIYDVLNDCQEGDKKTFVDPRSIIEGLCECEYDDSPFYVRKLVHLSLEKYAQIRAVVEKQLVDWKWERLPLLTRSIFLMSYAHYCYYGEEIDKRIVIDVAVELAKKYIDEKQAKFIHAVLDEVLK